MELEGNTRINVKVNGNDKETELTGVSPEITSEKLQELTNKISDLKDGDLSEVNTNFLKIKQYILNLRK